VSVPPRGCIHEDVGVAGVGAAGVQVPRVLVIDDLPIMGRGVRRMLSSEFQVTVLTSGREAQTLLRTSPDRFDVILTDLMMPEFTGLDLTAWLREHHPHLYRRLVIMTGSFDDPAVQEALSDIDCPCLRKPFSRSLLVDTLKSVIAST